MKPQNETMEVKPQNETTEMKPRRVWEGVSCRFAVFDDGSVMIDNGDGWKPSKKIKSSYTVEQFIAETDRKME